MSMQLKVNDKEYTVTYKFKAMYDSEFIKEIIWEEVLDRYIELKEIELRENLNANDKEMVKRKYFEYI